MKLKDKIAVVTGAGSGEDSSFVNGIVIVADGGWTSY
jgi:hypothetical protein